MEKRKLLLLKYFLNNCDEGYKVLEISKIFSSIKKYKGDFDILNSDIHFLSQNKYLDVKYLDENNVCLSILDNSHIMQENIRSDRSINRKFAMAFVISSISSGVMAFLGAFLAIILIR